MMNTSLWKKVDELSGRFGKALFCVAVLLALLNADTVYPLLKLALTPILPE
ncbi:MAG: hypothetical protein WC814_02945 [Candidatus Paceibacterota bacterium]|jgi:hypothetical protein